MRVNKYGMEGAVIEKVFIILTTAVQEVPLLAVGAAFLRGLLSMVLSPCHLSSIPLIVGFIDRQGRISTRQAFLIASAFSAGLVVSIAVIGTITALAGRMMGDVGRYGNYGVAFVFFLVGFTFATLSPRHGPAPERS
jgi:cytochrome c-type biogenesis protein